MTDDEIKAIDDMLFKRGLVRVHRICDGKVYFVSKRHEDTEWQPLWMWRETFVDAVRTARQEV